MDAPKPPNNPALDGALALVGRIADEVVVYRRKLKEAGVGDEAADRMAERMGEALMAAIEKAGRA